MNHPASSLIASPAAQPQGCLSIPANVAVKHDRQEQLCAPETVVQRSPARNPAAPQSSLSSAAPIDASLFRGEESARRSAQAAGAARGLAFRTLRAESSAGADQERADVQCAEMQRPPSSVERHASSRSPVELRNARHTRQGWTGRLEQGHSCSAGFTARRLSRRRPPAHVGVPRKSTPVPLAGHPSGGTPRRATRCLERRGPRSSENRQLSFPRPRNDEPACRFAQNAWIRAFTSGVYDMALASR
jgi:hypothetical protein